MKKKEFYAYGASEGNRALAKPLHKEAKPKEQEDEDDIPTTRVRNEYYSSPPREIRVLRF